MYTEDSGNELFNGLLVADLEGLYIKHGEMWNMYNRALRLLSTIISIPFITAGILLSANAITCNQVTAIDKLPVPIVWMVLLSGMLGLVWLQVLVNFRLDVILYAQAINTYRGLMISLSNGTIRDQLSTSPMPSSSSVPHSFEPLRHTGLIVLVSSLTNAIYMSYALARLSSMGSFLTWVLGIVLVLAQYGMYWSQAHRKKIEGQE